jgi:hypothetical protein
MASRRPQQSSDTPVSLAGGAPPESNRRPILTIRVVPLPYREAVQVKVTRMTVADREEARAPVRYGTRVARPVRMTAASPGGDGTSSGDRRGSSRATQASLASPRRGRDS